MSSPRGFTAYTGPGNDARLAISALPAFPGVAEAPTTAIERGAKSRPRGREAVSLERLATRSTRAPGGEATSSGSTLEGRSSSKRSRVRTQSSRPIRARRAGARRRAGAGRRRARRRARRCGRRARSRARSRAPRRCRGRRSREPGTRTPPGDSATRGGATSCDGAGVTPATVHSSTSGPNSALRGVRVERRAPR